MPPPAPPPPPPPPWPNLFSQPPPTYVIGPRKPANPLVTVEQVEDHLQLLCAFHRLRMTVVECRDSRIPRFATRMDSDHRWRWFVHLAIDRFEKWVAALQYAAAGKFLAKYHPPLDVCMVWHAYMLCPSWYAEDCERLTMLQYLRPLNMFALGSTDTETYARRQADVSRATSWYQQTRTSYDPFEDMTRRAYKQIECPRCRTKIFVPFVNDNSTGYAENFSAICPVSRCRMKITNETLAVAKFVRDFNQHSSKHDCMAGSLINSSGKRDPRRAWAIKDQLTRVLQYSTRMPLAADGRLAGLRGTSEIKEAIGYSLERLRDIVTAALRSYPSSTASRILGAYRDGSPFSVDLLDAVQRQSLFTEKMTELGWTKPAAFRGQRVRVLKDAILRYHAFLDLIASRPNSMFVPTLDIDLVWHTHQLMASQYASDCELYVGRYVDHELRIRESHLSAAFDETCLAWQLRYQVPYMQCGCALPDESSWQKCRRLVRQHLRSRTHLQVTLHPDHIPATHPSIHNALLSSRRRVDNMPGWMISHSDECRASSAYNARPEPMPMRSNGVQQRSPYEPTPTPVRSNGVQQRSPYEPTPTPVRSNGVQRSPYEPTPTPVRPNGVQQRSPYDGAKMDRRPSGRSVGYPHHGRGRNYA